MTETEELAAFRDLFPESSAPGATALERARAYRETVQIWANSGTLPQWVNRIEATQEKPRE